MRTDNQSVLGLVKESAPGARGRTLADLAKIAEEKPLKWLVPATILEDGIHVIHGQEESFKTTLAMQMLEALNLGGKFLLWDIPGGKRVGFAELEMTERIFADKAQKFLSARTRKPEIAVLSESQRRSILSGSAARDRVTVLKEWVSAQQLNVLAIDSSAKLFPPSWDIASQSSVSDVFSQLQSVGCTVILIAHDRKGVPGKEKVRGNEEIAGSGRFAQDPDIVLEVHRQDRRSPEAILSWGKNRVDYKPEDLEIFFDAVDHGLYALHPFLHLLPASREQVIEQAGPRFGWKRTYVDEWIASLKVLTDQDGNLLVQESRKDRQAIFSLVDSTRTPGGPAKELVEYSTNFIRATATQSGIKSYPVSGVSVPIEKSTTYEHPKALLET